MRAAITGVALVMVAALSTACGDGLHSPCGPEVGDADGDGVCDDVDNCRVVWNPSQADSDQDTFGDACDQEMGGLVCAGRGGDADGDDVCQAMDNCPEVANTDQRDQDGDGFGDACDQTPLPCDDLGGDTDGDTVCDDVDNCPEVANLNQLDSDADNIGDVCDDVVPTPGQCGGLGGDVDGDDWCGVYDNCPNQSNPLQEDSDGDGIGDACDAESCDGVDNDGDGDPDNGFPDSDGDGVADCVDPCPLEEYADSDEDGLEDCVDPCPDDPLNDADGDGLCAPWDNCPLVNSSNQNDRDGDGIGDVCDVEECDGISNDADTSIDEGMPDADGDGTCDDIDPCPNDPLDDADGDGLCAGADNCPSVANPSQDDDDDDGVGNACDIDSDEACGPSAVPIAPGLVPVPSDLQVSAIVVDPTRDVLYAAVPGSDATYPNRVVAIDGPSFSVLWTRFVGSEPDPLAVSDDGTILYVGLDGANSVRMVNLVARRACSTFPMPFQAYYGQVRAGEMVVVPGHPETLVVSARRSTSSPSYAGVYVFDNGVVRPVFASSSIGASRLAIASDTRVYGYSDYTTAYRFLQLSLTADGIVEDWQTAGLIYGSHVDIRYAEGRIYASSGAIVDPAMPSLAGTTNGYGPLAVDPTRRAVYYAESNTEVAVYDIDTYTYVDSIGFEGAAAPAQLEAWGDDGLAVLDQDGGLVVLDGVR